MDVLRLSKGAVLGTACPTCGAPASQYCRRSKKGSTANHQERVRAARRAAIIALKPAEKISDESEIERLRMAALNRVRGMDCSKDDKASALQFLSASRVGRMPSREQAKRLNEVLRYPGDWSPIDNDPFEIQGNRIVALPKAGELF